jgi:hypothetical protein
LTVARIAHGAIHGSALWAFLDFASTVRSAGGAHRARHSRLQGHRRDPRAEHPQRKFQRPDLHNAIHEAFRIAERRLRDLKEVRGTTIRKINRLAKSQSVCRVRNAL